MVDLSTVKTLFFTALPFLLPKLFSYYRVLRAKSASSPVPIRPLPRPVTYSLNILFVSAVLAFVSTLPYFSPENIFQVTSSRLQTPNDVLFTRLAAVRGGSLMAEDELLRPRIASLDARCLYFTYGPDVVRYCPFCMSDEPTSYLYYALPSLLLPHLLHLFAIGLATSNFVSGKMGNKWRTLGAAIGVMVASIDLYCVASYDHKANLRVFRPEEYVLIHWRMRIVRGVIICMADLVISGFLYLSSTNRLFVTPPTPAERMETALRGLDLSRGKINALGVIRNAVVRDEGLRRRTEGYWIREGKIMGEVMDEKDVVEGVKSALTNRIQMTNVESEAKNLSEGFVPLTQNEREALTHTI